MQDLSNLFYEYMTTKNIALYLEKSYKLNSTAKHSIEEMQKCGNDIN
jgi:hypothetical protein